MKLRIRPSDHPSLTRRTWQIDSGLSSAPYPGKLQARRQKKGNLSSPPPHRPALMRSLVWAAGWLTMLFSVVAFGLVGVAVAPTFLGYRSFAIKQGGISPSVWVGTAVVAARVPAEALQVGDLIVFSPSSADGQPTARRIVGLRVEGAELYFATQASETALDDSVEVSLGKSGWRVVYSVPLAGFVMTLARSVWGPLALVVLPGLILVAFDRWAGDPLRKPSSGRSA